MDRNLGGFDFSNRTNMGHNRFNCLCELAGSNTSLYQRRDSGVLGHGWFTILDARHKRLKRINTILFLIYILMPNAVDQLKGNLKRKPLGCLLVYKLF